RRAPCTRRSTSACLPRSTRVLRIRARALQPVTAPPIEDGAVLVDAAGRIAAIGPNSQVAAPPEARALEFPDAILVPGLVNCHTHLELTHLAGKNAEREFAPWIRAIRALKDATTPEEFSRSAFLDRKSTRLNSSHGSIAYAVLCLRKKTRSLAASDCRS